MHQRPSSVSFSLRKKLLLSAVSLLVLTIAFLTVSSILLFQKDKRESTYQSQSTEAVLAGREIVNTAKHTMDTLRLSLAYINPLGPMSSQQAMAFQFILENQIDLLAVTLAWTDNDTGVNKHYSTVKRADELSALGVTLEQIEIAPEVMKTVLRELKQNSYAFVNLSKPGEPPLLGIVLIEEGTFVDSGPLPFAVGMVSLRDFGKEFKKSHLTVATEAGRIVFDLDTPDGSAQRYLAGHPLFEIARGKRDSVGASDFSSAGVRYLGSYALPGLGLMVFAKKGFDEVMRPTVMMTQRLALLGFFVIIAAVFFAVIFSKSLTAPINQLYGATQEVTKGNFEVNLKVTSKDEIGALTEAFNSMSQQINGLILEKVESARIESELAIVSTVQQTLIPTSPYLSDRITIHSHYQPATECGGDWWGFFEKDNRMALMIADATGHGLPSALITASARSCFSVIAKLSEQDPGFRFSPSDLLTLANRVIYDVSLGRIMMTFFLAVIDFNKRTITYSSAGHNPPWFFRKGDSGFTPESLVANGVRLGETRDASSFEERSTSFNPGDIIFAYTDGLIEGTNHDGVAYGKKRARAVLENTVDVGTEKMIKATMEAFLEHHKDKPFDDDVTIAAALLLPRG